MQAPVVQINQGDALQGLLFYPSLLVKQKPRGWCTEMFLGCEVENEYGIYNPHQGGGKILLAKEQSDCCNRVWCTNMRSFEMSIHSMDGKEIVRYERPFHLRRGGLFCFCCDFGFQTIKAFSGNGTGAPGKALGYVRENCTFFIPEFSVMDENDKEVYRIVGECCGICTWTLHIYDLKSGVKNEERVGVIQKTWAGVSRELFTDADNFFITFPANSTAGERALLLGGLFLIDFLFFENKQNNNGF